MKGVLLLEHFSSFRSVETRPGQADMTHVATLLGCSGNPSSPPRPTLNLLLGSTMTGTAGGPPGSSGTPAVPSPWPPAGVCGVAGASIPVCVGRRAPGRSDMRKPAAAWAAAPRRLEVAGRAAEAGREVAGRLLTAETGREAPPMGAPGDRGSSMDREGRWGEAAAATARASCGAGMGGFNGSVRNGVHLLADSFDRTAGGPLRHHRAISAGNPCASPPPVAPSPP